jgi:protoporphyrinogen oxidase
MAPSPVVILGGGLAGLACADTLSAAGQPFVLIEQSQQVGGLTPSIDFEGCRFELGPHIYFVADDTVTDFWKGLVSERFRLHARQTKLYYNGTFIHSPLRAGDALLRLGIPAIAKMLLSFAWRRLKPLSSEASARDWVVGRFGEELYERFFKVYNEKIWGLPCEEIDPRWSGQRVKSSLLRILIDTFFKGRGSVVKHFHFPDGGSGTIMRALEQRIVARHCGDIRVGSRVIGLDVAGDRVARVQVEEVCSGDRQWIEASTVVSSIPVTNLAGMLPGDEGARAAEEVAELRYRSLVMVMIVVDAAEVLNFAEHWIDIHDPSVKALRVTNYANYRGVGLVPPGKAALSIEYNVFDDDELATGCDADIIAQARADLQHMGILGSGVATLDRVVRVPFAYPVYSIGFVERLAPFRAAVARFSNLITTGRNGLFKWNNMHHSVKTGQLAAQAAMDGVKPDLWSLTSSV